MVARRFKELLRYLTEETEAIQVGNGASRYWIGPNGDLSICQNHRDFAKSWLARRNFSVPENTELLQLYEPLFKAGWARAIVNPDLGAMWFSRAIDSKQYPLKPEVLNALRKLASDLGYVLYDEDNSRLIY